METMAEKNRAYVESIRADGGKILEFEAPCCGELIQTPAAPAGDTWDTAAACIHCGELYHRIVTHDAVTATN